MLAVYRQSRRPSRQVAAAVRLVAIAVVLQPPQHLMI
jgi:hypothetical protein